MTETGYTMDADYQPEVHTPDQEASDLASGEKDTTKTRRTAKKTSKKKRSSADDDLQRAQEDEYSAKNADMFGNPYKPTMTADTAMKRLFRDPYSGLRTCSGGAARGGRGGRRTGPRRSRRWCAASCTGGSRTDSDLRQEVREVRLTRVTTRSAPPSPTPWRP